MFCSFIIRISLLILCHYPYRISAEGHTLQFYFTALSSPLPGLSAYSIIGHVDDVFVMKYTSDSRRVQPAFQWMEERVDADHWDMMTRLGQHYEIVNQRDMYSFRDLFNQTHGLSVYQLKFACYMLEDGGIGGYLEFGFNGKEVVVFDKERLVYIPATHEAQVITQKWNEQMFSRHQNRDYIEKECIAWMKKYFNHGKSYFEKNVPPQVKVTDRESGGVTKLRCHVYGFYPRDVDVKWMKNGIDEVYSDEAKQILPNTDGTYQIRVGVEVTPKEGDSYSCYVDHSSLEKELIVPWEPKRSSSVYFAIAGVLAPLILVGSGIFAFRRFHGGRERVNTEDTD